MPNPDPETTVHNLRSLIASALLFGIGSTDAQVFSAASSRQFTNSDPHHGHRRSRAPAYKASPKAKSARFTAIAASCRPPARRHYTSGVRPLDKPKRLRDRRRWAKTNRFPERAIHFDPFY